MHEESRLKPTTEFFNMILYNSDPNSKVYLRRWDSSFLCWESSIPEVKRAPDPGSGSETVTWPRKKVFLIKKFFTKLSEIWSGIFIRDPGSGFPDPDFSIPGPGSRGQKALDPGSTTMVLWRF
jgi:hypothetical protein